MWRSGDGFVVNPRILVIESAYGVATEDVMDFWRPVYSDHAFVEGKYSSRCILALLEKNISANIVLFPGVIMPRMTVSVITRRFPRLVEKAIGIWQKCLAHLSP